VFAAVAVWVAFWLWPHGVVTIDVPTEQGKNLVATRLYGQWPAISILLGTIAAVLALDVIRQTVLAVRARPRKQRKNPASEPRD